MSIHASRLLALAVVLAPAAISCNAITGADDLIIEGEDGKGGSGSGSGNGAGNGSGNGSGAGSTGTGTVADMAPATGVSLREVALYQGVKRSLMSGGTRVNSNIPIVQGRDALVRVFYDTIAGYNGGPVTARLTIDGQAPMEVVQSLGGSSSDADLQSTINFDVPAAMMVAGMAYRIEMLQPPEQSTGENPAAVFPATGSDSIDVESSPSDLQVKLIPISYEADGSNRTPDTSSSQVQAYHNYFYRLYPVTTVEITVHAVVSWPNTISSNGAGWSSLLDALANFRDQENAPANVYYYGIFEPASTISQFCGGGCVAGLGFIASPSDSYGRAAIGLGYTGSIATETAVHEVGHNHGRPHAPCGGAAGPDPNYPYAGGKIGSWGYDILSGKLWSPTSTSDVMGYCSPIWISDYNYRLLSTRIQLIDGMNIVYPPDLLDRTWERVHVDGEGNVTFLDPVLLHRPPMGDPAPIEVQSPAGSESLQAAVYHYDHLDASLVLWPEGAAPSTSIQLTLAGKVITAFK